MFICFEDNFFQFLLIQSKVQGKKRNSELLGDNVCLLWVIVSPYFITISYKDTIFHSGSVKSRVQDKQVGVLSYLGDTLW